MHPGRQALLRILVATSSLLAIVVALHLYGALLGGSSWEGVRGPRATSGTVLPLPTPAPTEHPFRRDEVDDGERQRLRLAWIEEMHRAAQGVDWRAVERRNAGREMDRRRRLQEERRGESYTASWAEVGSRNQAGRIMTARITGDAVLYAGSALGGLWRSAPDGSSWEPLGDNLYGTVNELVVVPAPSMGGGDNVLVATGGADVHLTQDDGATWFRPAGLDGLQWVRTADRLADDTILLYGRVGSQVVLFASTNRGVTFTRRWETDSTFAGWMWVPRVGPESADTVYILQDGKLLHSGDGGWTFEERGNVDTRATRAVLTGSEAGAPHLYAAVQVGGTWQLHRSSDAGWSFTPVHTIQDFWESLCASSVDAGLVCYGGVEVYRSTDQGASFVKVNGWGDYYGDPEYKLHADIPGIHCWPDPELAGAEIWYVSTDGGVYESRDGMQSVRNLSLTGLAVSQYYSTHTSWRDPDWVLAGSQDQGYQRGHYRPPASAGPSTDFDQLISGDYGHLCSTDGTHDWVFCTYPGFVLIQEGEESPALRTVGFPSGSSHLWLPPVVAHRQVKSSFFFLGDRLWRYDYGSGRWTHTEHSSQDFAAHGDSYLSALAFAPSDPDRVYAAGNRGTLWFSMDGGLSWTRSPGTGPQSHYFYGSALAVHRTNPDEAYVGGSGYSSPGVLRTRDGGQSWQPVADGLPATLVYDLAYSACDDGLYAATESGAYRFDPATDRWSTIMEPGTPLTLYWSVEAVPGRHAMRFGTYGRGIWDYQICDTPTEGIVLSLRHDAVVGGLAVDDEDLILLDPDAGTFSMLFDASDVAVPPEANVDAAAALSDGSLLLSFAQALRIPGLVGGPQGDLVEDEDLVRFVPISLGDPTAGTFEFYFDGSDVDLERASEDVDAVSVDAAGNLYLSTRGKLYFGASPAGRDEDVFRFTPTSFGADTAGTWELVFKGKSDQVKLGRKGEDVDAFQYQIGTGVLFLSTTGDFRVPRSQFGQDDDVLRFTPSRLGDPTEGFFDVALDGAAFGLGPEDIDALHVFGT